MATIIREIRGHQFSNKRASVRRKRSDTHVGTIERQYGLDFGVRSDMHLGTLLERRNAEWLRQILQEDDSSGTE